MKLKPEALRELILEEMGRLILEQPEDEDAAKGDEEAAGEEAAGEGETTEDEEPEQAEEDAQEEEPEKPDLEPEDKFMAGHSIDKALENVMGDYEERALTNESTKFSLKLLFEKSELPKIDISQFASDVARLINNYEYLLDMEAIIFNKAENFLLDKYGPDVATEFVDEMKDHHDIDFSRMPTEKEHHYTVTGAPGGSDVGYTGGTE
jgi:hypothetical protein